MFNIDEKAIRGITTYGVYQKGMECYLNNQVDFLDLKATEQAGIKRMLISASVKSSSNTFKKYDVRVSMISISKTVSCSCSCPAYSDYYNYSSPCKHITAVLLKYAREKDEIMKNDIKKKNNRLIYSLKESLTAPKQQLRSKALNLTYKLDIENGYNSSNYLELKVGEEKLYVVKNMREFLESVSHAKELEFGKNFSYNPYIHSFKDEDKEIIKLLLNIYETDKAAEDLTRYGDKPARFLSGKKAYLTEGNLKRFLKLLEERTIDVTIDRTNYINVQIIKDNFPLQFNIKSSNKELMLQQVSELPIPITGTGSCFFYNSNIYMPTDEQVRIYKPILNTFLTEGKTKIIFTEDESEELASYVIPALKKISEEVTIDKSIQKKFYEEPLKSEIYLDKDDDAVTAKIIYKYGDIEINPLKKNKDTQREKVLVRDIEGEALIVDTITFFNFEKAEESFILEDEEKILDFIANGLETLQEIGEVYYSDSFKNIKVYASNSYKSNIRLNDEDLLEFSFNIDGVSKEELKNIFDSLKQKKKYHRLKSGGFIPLQSKELQHMSQMIDYLNIKTSDLEKDRIILSKYNAVYIDSTLKDNNIAFVERNKKFRELVNSIKDVGDIDYTIPADLENIMRSYQKFGFKWFKTLSNCGFGGILADEMGLGKTLQTIAFIASEVGQEREQSSAHSEAPITADDNRRIIQDFSSDERISSKEKQPSLVVCPTSLVYNWEDEVNKFQPGLKCLVVSGNKEAREEQRKKIEEADIVITSYALIKRDIEEYKDIKFKYCFLDEAQNIKNPDSLNAQSVKTIKAKGYFALTGTPIENSLTELWSIFDFIMPGYLLNHRKFAQKYEIPIVKNGDKKSLEELNRHIKPFILRRLKKDVIKELPPKIEHNIIIDMTEEQKKVYASYLQQAKEEVDEEIRDKGLNKSKIKILSILTRLRQICCDPSTFIENYNGDNGKMEALMDMVGNNISQGHKILLFSQFTSVLKNIGAKFQKQGIKYMYLDGSTKAEDRGELVKEFNQGDTPIFLISLKAGGTGLNLTSADTVIHFDPWWNPAVEEQASDRAHRIG